MLTLDRRRLLAAGAATGALAPFSPALAAPDPWDEAKAILARIKPPTIPKRDFPITNYGAKPGGDVDCSKAIAQAIDAASKAGGGRIIVPAGVWLTGAIHLKSRTELHVEKDATLKFSRDFAAYLPVVLTRHEGIELMNYSPFIYALEQTDIAVTGEGTLDGQADADHWWNWARRPAPGQPNDRELLGKMGEDGTPVENRVFGAGKTIRTMFFQPYRCKNVMIEGVKIVASPMWELHPVECVNFIARNVEIHSHGPNNDGCDPESCTDVLIDNCVFDTGDDCIAIKSGRNAEGRRLKKPALNHIIRNCRMIDGHGGVTLGSEITAGVRNVFIENCKMDSPRLDIALRFKNNAMRGGDLENIYARNIAVGQVAHAVIAIDYNYQEGANGPYQPVFKNLVVENLVSGKSERALDLEGFANTPIHNVTLRNCQFSNVAKPDVIKHVQGLVLERVTVDGKPVTAPANYD